MRTTRIVIADSTRQTLSRSLNRVLADAIALRLQAQHAHWNVRGRHFAPRHELFEQLFTNLDTAIDSMAERIAAIGGGAEGRVAEIARVQSIPTYDPTGSTSHLPALADSYAAFASELREELSRATMLNEPVTEDLLTQTLREVEHDLYLLEAHIEPMDSMAIGAANAKPRPRETTSQPAVAEA